MAPTSELNYVIRHEDMRQPTVSITDWAFQFGLLTRWLIAAFFVAAAYCAVMSVIVSRVTAPYTAEYLKYAKEVSEANKNTPVGTTVEVPLFVGRVRESPSILAQPTTLAAGVFAAAGLLLVIWRSRRTGRAG